MMARLRMRLARPTLYGGLIGWTLAQAPGQLPRPEVVSGAVGVVSLFLGAAVGGAVGRVVGRRSPANRADLAAASGLVLAVTGSAVWWQRSVTGHLDLPAPGVGWFAATAVLPVLAGALALALPRRAWAAVAVVTAMIAAPAATSHAAPRIPTNPSMIYSAIADDGAAGFDERARALVAHWADTGGTHERAVVVAVPTGSGWVDAGAVTGFEEHFGGSVRVLALQYSQVPSWQAYLYSSEPARRSATALVRAVTDRVRTLPADSRPAVHLFGQSLGAIGADSARSWAADNSAVVDGTVLSGAPAGGIAQLASCERRVVLANATDPVPDFSWSLLWRAPHRPDVTTVVGAGRSDRPWIPVLSALGTAVDLAVSLEGPPGTGHRYGTEQGRAVADLPAGCGVRQATGPRAAS